MWQALENCAPGALASVQLFRLALPATLESCGRLRVFLSPREQERLQGFKVESSAVQYVQVRAALRILLGTHLGVSPREVGFEYSDLGKPVLVAPRLAGFCFNVSHTEDWGMVALSAGGDVGVDVEKHKPSRDLEAVARRSFSALECEAVLGQSASGNRCEAFYDTWTAKEACIKATGSGIGSQLHGFSVALGAPGVLRCVEFRDNPTESSRWSLVGVPMPKGWSAAVAVRGEPGEASYLGDNPPALFELCAGFWESALLGACLRG